MENELCKVFSTMRLFKMSSQSQILSKNKNKIAVVAKEKSLQASGTAFSAVDTREFDKFVHPVHLF